MADYIISYDDVALQAAVPGAHVLDVKVDAMPIDITVTKRTYGKGGIVVHKRVDVRDITITIELPLTPTQGSYAENMRLLRNWAERSSENALVLPDYPGKKIMCILSKLPDLSLKNWYKPIDAVFTAVDDPYFISIDESTGNVGESFSVLGDANASPIITHEISDALENPAWTLGSGYAVILMGTFSSGTIVINTAKQYVSLNDESLLSVLASSSRFCEYPKGSHVITGPSGGVITWNERWRN